MIRRLLLPFLLFIAAVTALLPSSGGSIYFAAAGLWALIFAVLSPRALGDDALPAFGVAAALLLPTFVGMLFGPAASQTAQFVLLPAAAYLLSHINIRSRDIGAADMLPGLTALLANAFLGLSALVLYYIDRVAGTSLVPSNEAFMLHISAALIGVGAMYLLFTIHRRLARRAA